MIVEQVANKRGILTAVCVCDWCGEEFERYLSDVKNNSKNYCCERCMWNALRYSHVGKGGKEAPNWRGGKKRDKKGYVLIYKPQHPRAVKGGYVLEHRLVMEKVIERYLKPQEIVHHINGIRDDNRPENLMLFKNDKEHQKYHYKQRDLVKI